MGKIGLRGNYLPDSEKDFEENIGKKRMYTYCVHCNKVFTDDNVFTPAGWRETQISGFCEICFDKLFNKENHED